MKNSQKINILDEIPGELSTEWIRKAVEKLDSTKLTPREREQYMRMIVHNAAIVEEKEETEKKWETLIEETKKEFKKEKLTAAKELKATGLNIATIANILKLKIEDVENL